MLPDLHLLHPERAAHATIRGFLYQTCLGVLRWLELAPEEVLVCEGDEDLDRLIRGGVGISEQVKAYSGSLGLGDRAVSDSLRNFFLAYVALRRRGEDRRFRFITTARLRRQRAGDRLDVLREWQAGERGSELVGAVRTLLADLDPPAAGGAVGKRGTEVEESLAWLDAAPEGWRGFLDAVEWSFDAPDLPGVRQEIRNRLSVRESARHLPGETLVDRLIAELLEASSRKDVQERLRTAADLERLLAAAGAELASWAASPEAMQIRAVFDELRQVGRLLHDNTADLPPNPGPGKLLTAAYEVVPFEEEGRSSELEMLETWCGAAEKRSVLLLTGAGGSGKTRLLIEWCHRLRYQGWHAGFLGRGLVGSAIEEPGAPDRGSPAALAASGAHHPAGRGRGGPPARLHAGGRGIRPAARTPGAGEPPAPGPGGRERVRPCPLFPHGRLGGLERRADRDRP